MKLIYQNMLGFLLIIVTTISIIGYSEIGYARNQAYMQNYQRMESYANSLGELAETDGKNGTALLNDNFLNQLEFVLRGDDVHLRIFDDKNTQIYPRVNAKVQLSDKIFSTLQNGQEIRIQNNHTENSPIGSTKDAYTGVLVPWMNGKNLVGIAWISSRVKHVERPIYMAKRNLLRALLITVAVGLILSFILIFNDISDKIMKQITSKAKLNLSQIRLLLFFDETQNKLMTMGELAKGLQISLSTLSRQLKQNITLSLLHIDVNTKNSTKLVQLNQSGIEKQTSLKEIIASVNQDIFQYWDESELGFLTTELSLINKRLNS